MKKYSIECTEEELHVIRQCVEVCHRISCGQIEDINELLPNAIGWDMILDIKREAFPELIRGQSYSWNGGYGKLHEPKNKKFAEVFNHFQAITYPIYREILHYWAVKKGLDSVYQSETLNAGHGGFVKIKEL